MGNMAFYIRCAAILSFSLLSIVSSNVWAVKQQAEHTIASPLEPQLGQQSVISKKNVIRNTDDLYFVRLEDAPLATYQGEISGLAATSRLAKTDKKPIGKKLNVHSADSQRYLNFLKNKRTATLKHLANRLKKPIKPKHTYQYALNGFTGHFTLAEVAQLQQDSAVKQVLKIKPRYLLSDTGPDFVQAPSVWHNSLISQQSAGEGIIIGIIDSGISPNHPSFSAVGDDGYVHTNPLGSGNYLGDCALSEFAHYCNDKLIGIWSHPEITDDYTPFGDDQVGIDHDGHGTHVASIAAGNIVKNVPVFNVIGDLAEKKVAQISGVAPHANIVSYQVCAADVGCWPDLTALAVEHAIEHGVDVLNYSVGGESSDPWASVDALAFLSAREAGIHVAVSAGNDGPEQQTISSPANAPWLTSVAAVNHGRNYQEKSISFSGGNSNLASLTGAAITNGVSGPIIFAGDVGDEDCLTPFATNSVVGKIVVCTRNDIPRVEKGRNVLAGGAIGMVLINDPDEPSTNNIVADYHVLPAIHLNNQQGQDLLDWLASGNNHRASISGVVKTIDPALAGQVADFSSRGPNTENKQWLIPAIAAPGVDIYAAYSNYQPHYSASKKNETDYTFLNGTSMASPHLAGAFALIAAVHPDWSPAEVQSALMLSADFSNTKIVNNERVSADFFDVGAGNARIDRAIKAGLIMDVSKNEYSEADPELGGMASSLNLPALMNEKCRITCTWQRRFTATENASWQASTEQITAGGNLTVSPSSFQLAKGESITLTFTFEMNQLFGDDFAFARVLLTPSNNNLSVSALPVIGQFIPGDFPDDTKITAHTDAGSETIAGIKTLGTNEFSAQAYQLVPVVKKNITIARDGIDEASWPENIYNNDNYYYAQPLSIPANTQYLLVKINSTRSPDLDLYVGFDGNGNGRPDSISEISNAICQAATKETLEVCRVVAPPAGDYFIVIHNYGNPSSANHSLDNVAFELAIVGQNDQQLSLDYNNVAVNNTDVDLTLNWTPPLTKGQEYFTVLAMGTSLNTPDNIGYMPVKLTRSERIIEGSINKTTLTAGEQFTLTFVLDANTTSEEKLITLDASIPSNSSVVSDSHQGQINGNKMQWQINQAANSGMQTIIATFATDVGLSSGNTSISYTYVVNDETSSYVIRNLAIQAIAEPNNNVQTTSSGSSSGGVFSILLVLLFSLKYLKIKLVYSDK